MTAANATQDNKKKKSYVERAEDIKKFLQGIIAFSIVILLFLKLLFHLRILPNILFVLHPLLAQKTLQIVGECLAFSAAVDLAYMLLTPGPDEAIEPLILGLASAILFSISNIQDTADINLALEIGVYVVILAILFIMKALFIEDAKGNSQWNTLFKRKKK